MAATHHLAQVNIGRLRYADDDPRLAEFFDSLGRINAVAERMPGFIWRLKDEGGEATVCDWPGDPSIIVNITVWESIEALEKFVWQTAHTRVYGKKHEWFEKHDRDAYFAMWWIPAGHLPTIEEAKERIDHLAAHGSTDFSFGWDGAPQAKLWLEKRCA